MESTTLIPVRKHISRNSTPRSKAKYVSKVKCLTLQPVQGSATKGRMMLGLKDPKEQAGYEYESRCVSVPHKRLLRSSKRSRPSEKAETPGRNSNVPSSKPSSLVLRESAAKTTVPENNFKSSEPVKEQNDLKYKSEDLVVPEQNLREKPKGEVVKHEASMFESPEQNEENSKAFMESIGCWINDFFSVPNKRSISPKGEKQVLNTELVSKEDAEYLKSITTIKEQFRKKLKNETTVHVSASETPFELNFDKDLDNPKKMKKRAKLQLSKSNLNWFAELDDNLAAETEGLPRTQSANALIIRTGETDPHQRPAKLKDTLDVPPDMTKGKKKLKRSLRSRHGALDMDDSTFPKAGELSKKLLLNMNDQEKFAQFYKSTHLATQDYGQRKVKTYQSNTRCYTTKAKGRGVLSGRSFSPGRGTYYSSTHPKSLGEVLSRNNLDISQSNFRNSSRKSVPELTRDSISFSKVNVGRAVPALQDTKLESKSSSDDLVKYLMKKIKSSRSQLVKKKGKTKVPQILGAPKIKFMQSATSNLIMNVMARENKNQLTSKSVSRMYLNNKEYPTKELMLKQCYTTMRLDLAKEKGCSKLSRFSYLLEKDKPFDEDLPYEKSSVNDLKPDYEDPMRADMFKTEKLAKRQEVKRLLFNLDANPTFPDPKTRPKKDLTAKQNSPETRDLWQNPRFKKQHELFKKSVKLAQAEQIEETESAIEAKNKSEEKEEEKEKENEKEMEFFDCSPSTEIAVTEPVPNQQEAKKPIELPNEASMPKSIMISPENQENNRKEVEAIYKEKPAPEKRKKEKPPNEKEPKIKAVTKGNDAKSLMNPLGVLCNPENQIQEDPAKRTYGVHISPKELGAGKPSDSTVINRRYSSVSTLPRRSSKFATFSRSIKHNP